MQPSSDIPLGPSWETPDIWYRSYLQASGDHRRMIHNAMVKHCLTVREATQKVFKCDERAAQSDTLPTHWNTPIIQKLRHREALRVIGHDIHALVDAMSVEPCEFDLAIAREGLVRRFLRTQMDRQGADKPLKKL